jgi:hypothetical protein
MAKQTHPHEINTKAYHHSHNHGNEEAGLGTATLRL